MRFIGRQRRPLLCRQVGVDPRRALRRDVKTELRAPPQDIVRAARPFAPDQIIDFGCREAAAEILAEIGHGSRRRRGVRAMRVP